MPTQEIILLFDIEGLGKTYEIKVVPHEEALDLYERRLALQATPPVRRRFGEYIRRQALSK